jgi:hypothetical protein
MENKNTCKHINARDATGISRLIAGPIITVNGADRPIIKFITKKEKRVRLIKISRRVLTINIRRTICSAFQPTNKYETTRIIFPTR